MDITQTDGYQENYGTNEKAPIKGLKNYRVFEPGTVVYVRHDMQTVKRLIVGSISINTNGVFYLFGMSTVAQSKVFATESEAFKD